MRIQDQKSGESRLNLQSTILERKSIGSDQRNELKVSELMIWRTKMQARVQLKDSICFKWVQIVSYELDPRTN
jgi:hypothetical protein